MASTLSKSPHESSGRAAENHYTLIWINSSNSQGWKYTYWLSDVYPQSLWSQPCTFPHNNWQRKRTVGEPALSSWIVAGDSPGFPAGGDLGDCAKGVREDKPPNLLAARSWYPQGPSFHSTVCLFSVMLLSGHEATLWYICHDASLSVTTVLFHVMELVWGRGAT